MNRSAQEWKKLPEFESTSLSTLLKDATREAHTVVERHESVDALITGLLPRDVHIQYLICLYHIYLTMETEISKHAPTNICLCYNYDPTLFRSHNLEQDICFFLDLPQGSKWQMHPLALNMPGLVLDALAAYTNRLKSLSNSEPTSSTAQYTYEPSVPCPELLLAHEYVRYMGDLSGGQAIRKSVAAAYSLPLDSIDGQRFYSFGLESSRLEIKALKAKFRAGLDLAGNELSIDQKATMLQEANHAFELNVKLFSSFAPSLSLSRPNLLNVSTSSDSSLSTYSLESFVSSSSGSRPPSPSVMIQTKSASSFELFSSVHLVICILALTIAFGIHRSDAILAAFQSI